MAISLISLSSAGIGARAPSTSLTFTCSRRITSSLSVSNSTIRSGLLHSSFAPCTTSLSSPSTFSGLSFGSDMTSNMGMRRRSGFSLVVRAGKAALCQTKRNRSRKSLARTHGFRLRMRTTSGRAILKRRRAKGRKVLCTKSYPNRGPKS